MRYIVDYSFDLSEREAGFEARRPWGRALAEAWHTVAITDRLAAGRLTWQGSRGCAAWQKSWGGRATETSGTPVWQGFQGNATRQALPGSGRAAGDPAATRAARATRATRATRAVRAVRAARAT